MLAGLTLLLNGQAVRAQTPAWQTAILSTLDRGNQAGIDATTSDANGNVYVVGSFLGTIQIGSTTLTSVGSTDVFVAKWSSRTGTYLWAQRAGGSGTDYIHGVSVSGTSVYVAGEFFGSTTTFGATTLTNADASANTSDIFVAKLTDAGTASSFAWAQRAGGADGEGARSVTGDGSNVYVVGSFSSATARFGAITLTNASPSTDIFIAKLTDGGSTGSFSWAQRAGGESQEEATAVAVQGQNVYVTGFFRSRTASFGSLSLPNLSLGSFSSDGFLVKLLDTGASASFAWARQAGGDEDDQASGIAVNGANVYVTGWFNSPTVRFGVTTLTTTRYHSAAFVAKLTDTGSSSTFQWAQQSQSAGYTLANSLAVMGASVYVAGEFYDAPARFGPTTLPGVGSMDVFVAKLTDAGTSGSFAWAQQAGGLNFDRPTAVTVTGTRVCVAGLLTGAGSFGALNIGLAGGHGFLATLTDNASPVVPTVRINRSLLPILTCAHDTTITLSANVPGGTWSGLGIMDAQQGTFRSSTAGPGRHVLTYSVASVGQDTCSIVVRPVVVQVQAMTRRFSCLRDTSFALGAAPKGGNWQGKGIINSTSGLFSTVAAGPGRHVLTYTVGTTGPCVTQDTLSIVVQPVRARILTIVPPLCRPDTLVHLTATPTGGTWRGPGITNGRQGLFTGTAAGVGRHTLRYELGSGACQTVDSITILIRPVATPMLSPAGSLTLRCGQPEGQLSVANAMPSNVTYEWQYAAPASTSWQRVPSAGGSLTYRASQAGQYRVRAVQGGCFAYSTPVEVRVEPVQAQVVPNIFTPNHDGVNDLFELRLQYPRTSQLQVFNRWGRLVFSTDTYGDFWTGTDAPDGVYYYLWRYSTECEPTEHFVRGSISVVH